MMIQQGGIKGKPELGGAAEAFPTHLCYTAIKRIEFSTKERVKYDHKNYAR